MKYNLPEVSEQGLSQSTTLQSYPSTLQSYPPSISSPGYYQAVDLYSSNPRYHIITGTPTNGGLVSANGGVLLSPIPTVSAPLLQGGEALCMQERGTSGGGGSPHTITNTSTPQRVILQSQTLRSMAPMTSAGRHKMSSSSAVGGRQQNVYTMSQNPRTMEHIYQVCR